MEIHRKKHNAAIVIVNESDIAIASVCLIRRYGAHEINRQSWPYVYPNQNSSEVMKVGYKSGGLLRQKENNWLLTWFSPDFKKMYFSSLPENISTGADRLNDITEIQQNTAKDTLKTLMYSSKPSQQAETLLQNVAIQASDSVLNSSGKTGFFRFDLEERDDMETYGTVWFIIKSDGTLYITSRSGSKQLAISSKTLS